MVQHLLQVILIDLCNGKKCPQTALPHTLLNHHTTTYHLEKLLHLEVKRLFVYSF